MFLLAEDSYMSANDLFILKSSLNSYYYYRVTANFLLKIFDKTLILAL